MINVSLVILMPAFRAGDLSDVAWKKVQLAKANIGEGNNREFLLKLVDDYNESRRTKGRDIL